MSRLAYLSSSRLPSPFANSVHVVKMCRAFARDGHSVTLHARAGGGDPLTPYGVEHCFDVALSPARTSRVLGPALFALATRRRVAKIRPELLYARHVWSLVACASLGIPFVYEAHALPRTALHRRIERWLFAHRGFRRLVVISQVLRDDYLEAFPGLGAQRVVVAHDGADVAADATPTSAWQGREGALQVGYIGHLYPGKGMEIVAGVAPRMPHVDFHVVGGTEADLKRWRHAVNAPNVHFHGFVAHATLPAAYAAMDVVLIPVQRQVSLQNGKGEIGRWTSPLKLFEAMAHRRAMIVSDHPTLVEVVTNEVNALVVPAADVDAWAGAIERLAADPALRRRLGNAALETLQSEYTWQQRAQRVLEGIAA